MKCAGDGLLYLADYGADVVVINLNNDSLSVNGTNLLAFDAHLTVGCASGSRGWRSSPARACGTSAVQGTGWVALTSRGTPIVVDCGRGEDETYVDPDALVAWSPNLKVKGKRSFKASLAHRAGQRRGVPDGLLRPGHRRRAAERGQHRPPADPGLSGGANTSCRVRFSATRRQQSQDRYTVQNPQLLRVALTGHDDVLARKGAMVAYQGLMEFDGEYQSHGPAPRPGEHR